MLNAAQTDMVKSIAIIGAGSAGLAMLKSLLDLPESTKSNLNIVLFERRHKLGGIWLPDPQPAPPPETPETPLYPLLRTNTPAPFMTYPGFPFTKGTPLYPTHEYVEAYHRRYAAHYKLTDYIRFNHTILKASWVGNTTAGHWSITYRDDSEVVQHATFGHLVVATGLHNIPRIPIWQGQQDWLDNSPVHGPKREIMHSFWYRGPEKYARRRVLVVGAGSSGLDMVAHALPYASEIFMSMTHKPDPVVGVLAAGVQTKPAISHFTTEGVEFIDRTTLEIDVVLLGTGYEIRQPFLEDGGVLVTDRHAHSIESFSEKLVTNTNYIFPLHQHVFSLSPSYLINALAFIGLASGAIGNCPTDAAQSTFATHVILNDALLPSRATLLKELAEREDHLRQAGYDPYIMGHKLPFNLANDYQDGLIAYLKANEAIPDDGQNYVEDWRRDVLRDNYRLRRAWKRVESLGSQHEWVGGVETVEQWAGVLRQINVWQEEWEKSRGLVFIHDSDDHSLLS